MVHASNLRRGRPCRFLNLFRSARAFGVRSAMPSVTAKRKCPELIFVPPRFDVYRAVSVQIREIFAEHTDLIEPLSLDEHRRRGVL